MLKRLFVAKEPLEHLPPAAAPQKGPRKSEADDGSCGPVESRTTEIGGWTMMD